MKLRISGISLLVVGLAAFGLTACDPTGSITVDDDGQAALNDCNSTSPAPSTIQAGVNAATTAGQIVRVCPGVYSGDVNVNKPIKLLGNKSGVDGRTRTVTPANESKVTGTGVAAGRMQVTVSDVTVDGFLFEGNDTAALYTSPTVDNVSIVNNVFRANTFGLYLHGNGADAELSVQKNLFASNNGPAGAAAGNGIYSDQGLNTADVSFNKFQHNDNGGILVAGTPSGPVWSNVTVTNNDSVDNSSFIAFFGAHNNVKVRNNTVTDTDPNDDANQGSQIFVGDGGAGASPTGILITGNTMSNSPANGVAVRDASYNIDVISNTISGAQGAAVSVSSTANGAASEVRSNTTDNNVTYGIEFRTGTSGTYITANHATGNGTDCFDATTGRQRAGVKNIWRIDNIGNTSSPAGLCHP